jgi:hypothetical protein
MDTKQKSSVASAQIDNTNYTKQKSSVASAQIDNTNDTKQKSSVASAQSDNTNGAGSVGIVRLRTKGHGVKLMEPVIAVIFQDLQSWS